MHQSMTACDPLEPRAHATTFARSWGKLTPNPWRIHTDRSCLGPSALPIGTSVLRAHGLGRCNENLQHYAEADFVCTRVTTEAQGMCSTVKHY